MRRRLVVAGPRGPARELWQALVVGGDGDAVRDASGGPPQRADLSGAAALVHVVAGGAAGPSDEEALRLAERLGVRAVCVLADAGTVVVPVPYVLATDVVPVTRGADLPVERIATRVAAATDTAGAALASRLPVLRRPVCAEIVHRASRQSALVAAAVFVPGADLPGLVLNQARMVLRIATAHGAEIDRERALELLAVAGAGVGLRALARGALAALPGPGWAYQAGVAYAGTRAIGAAAIAYFEGRAEGSVRPRS